MENDVFADLLPIAPPPPPAPSSVFQEDAVLPARPELPDVPTTTKHSEGGKVPMGDSRHRREARETEAMLKQVLEGSLERFTSGIHTVLQEICRRLEGLEQQSRELNQGLADVRAAIGAQDESFTEQLKSVEDGVHEVHRSVQIVRDKQELADSQVEMMKLTLSNAVAAAAATAPPPKEAASPASSISTPAEPPASASQGMPIAPLPVVLTPPAALAPVAVPQPEVQLPTAPALVAAVAPPTPPAPPQPPSGPQQAYAPPSQQLPKPPQQQYVAPPPPPPQGLVPQGPHQYLQGPAPPSHGQQAYQSQVSAPQPPQPQQVPPLPQGTSYGPGSVAPPAVPQGQPLPSGAAHWQGHSAPPYGGQAAGQQQGGPPPPSTSQAPPGTQYLPSGPTPHPSRTSIPLGGVPPPPGSHLSAPPGMSGPPSTHLSYQNPPPPGVAGNLGGPVSMGYPPPGSAGGLSQRLSQGMPGGYAGLQAYPTLPPQGHPRQSPGGFRDDFVSRRSEEFQDSRQQRGRERDSYSEGSLRDSQPGTPSGGSGGGARTMTLERLINDVAAMGFTKHEVRNLCAELSENGQAVDLNVVLDRLMNGRR